MLIRKKDQNDNPSHKANRSNASCFAFDNVCLPNGFIFYSSFLIGCSANIDVPNNIDSGIVDAPLIIPSVIPNINPPNTCNILNNYAKPQIQKFACKKNDGIGDYWWRSWQQWVSCSDTAHPCIAGSQCINPSIGAGRCAFDVMPYCDNLDGTGKKYYCNTASDVGFAGWWYETNGDCIETNCPTGAGCLVFMYGVGEVSGVCGQ